MHQRRDDAYSLMSVAADFGVTQVVDGRQGVHARVCHAIFPPEWDARRGAAQFWAMPAPRAISAYAVPADGCPSSAGYQVTVRRPRLNTATGCRTSATARSGDVLSITTMSAGLPTLIP